MLAQFLLRKKRGDCGLRNMELLSSRLGFPHRNYRSIHVAGSNGKGSVCYKIAMALSFEGYRVGLYTSPHLHHFSERIAIIENGTSILISENEIDQGLEELFRIEKEAQIDATFFEISTQLALIHFSRRYVDIAVIEAGIGGRLDSTNIIDPMLTIITSISKEHADLLGDNLESIAKEKAGIIKVGIPCVVGPSVMQESVEKKALECGSELIRSKIVSVFYEEENKGIATCALELLGVSDNNIQRGILTRLSCRFEKKGNMILDVAHNPDAFMHLVDALEGAYPLIRKRFIIGMCADKEMKKCLEHVIPIATHIHLVQAQMARAAPVQQLAEYLDELGFQAYSCYNSVADGVDGALHLSVTTDELLIVCGSFYIIQEMMGVCPSSQWVMA